MLLVEPLTFIKALPGIKDKDGKEMEAPGTLEALREIIKKLNQTDLVALSQGGARMMRFTLETGAVLYIPMGWITVERACESTQIHYGVRKSWFTKTKESAAVYKFIYDTLCLGPKKTDSSRMAEILAVLGADLQERAAAQEALPAPVAVATAPGDAAAEAVASHPGGPEQCGRDGLGAGGRLAAHSRSEGSEGRSAV